MSDRATLEALLVKEGHIISTREDDGRRKFWEVVDRQPVSFYSTVRGITGSRLAGKDATGGSTNVLDINVQTVLKQLRPDEGNLLQLLVGFDAEPHRAAQRIFFEAPVGTTGFDFDQGRSDSKNIGFIDGRVSRVEALSLPFAVWLTHNLSWGLKFVNNYPLTVDPAVWFLGALFLPDLIGIETSRGGDVTRNGKASSANNPVIRRPERFQSISVGRIRSVPTRTGDLGIGVF